MKRLWTRLPQNSRFLPKLALFDRVSNPIGLDVGLEKLNMVQVEISRGQPTVRAVTSVFHNADYQTLLSNPSEMKALIKSALKSRPFRGRKVVSTLPGSKLKLTFLNYHCAQKQEESEALLAALPARLDVDLNEMVVDYAPITPKNVEQTDRTAMVALARRQDIEDYLDLLDRCGLSAVALEIGPIAIKRLIGAMRRQNDPQKVLAINFGSVKSYLTVIWNQDVLLDREVDFGMETVLKALSQSLEIESHMALGMLHKYGLTGDTDHLAPSMDEHDEEITKAISEILIPVFVVLAREIRDVLVYVASETRGGAVEHIYLLGSLARLLGIDEIVDGLVSIPVKTINPFYGLAVNHASTGIDDIGPVAGIAVATGLALRGVAL